MFLRFRFIREEWLMLPHACLVRLLLCTYYCQLLTYCVCVCVSRAAESGVVQVDRWEHDASSSFVVIPSLE